jgi:hypothetical protein
MQTIEFKDRRLNLVIWWKVTGQYEGGVEMFPRVTSLQERRDYATLLFAGNDSLNGVFPPLTVIKGSL